MYELYLVRKHTIKSGEESSQETEERDFTNRRSS